MAARPILHRRQAILLVAPRPRAGPHTPSPSITNRRVSPAPTADCATIHFPLLAVYLLVGIFGSKSKTNDAALQALLRRSRCPMTGSTPILPAASSSRPASCLGCHRRKPGSSGGCSTGVLEHARRDAGGLCDCGHLRFRRRHRPVAWRDTPHRLRGLDLVERVTAARGLSRVPRGIRDEERLGARSLGILGMRERAALIGATFVTGNPAQGTAVTVRIPFGEQMDDIMK